MTFTLWIFTVFFFAACFETILDVEERRMPGPVQVCFCHVSRGVALPGFENKMSPQSKFISVSQILVDGLCEKVDGKYFHSASTT